MMLSNLLINANMFNFCYAPEDSLRFFCCPCDYLWQCPKHSVPHAAKGLRHPDLYRQRPLTYCCSLSCISFYFFPLACIFANFSLFWISSELHTGETISQSLLFILEVISLHYPTSFIHIFENMLWSILPRNLQLSPQARLVVFVTAYL